uniref:Translational activator of cytochrome c oxidase 1 (inferred by orthology to a human protein) n=1 Tax=Strongyloides venezuelensis TaxID=75913 RepID=A0A0K0G0L7_STRVS
MKKFFTFIDKMLGMRSSMNGFFSKFRTVLAASKTNITSSFYTSPLNLKGHSKWDNIKDIKGRNDLLKSKKISYLLNKMKSVVKEGGFDIKTNKKLNDLQLEFKSSGIPLDQYNGYLKKIKEKPEIVVNCSVIGPSGSLFIVECETDNLVKTENALGSCLKKLEGFRLSKESVISRFEEKGVITISNVDKEGKKVTTEKVEEMAIKSDIEEVEEIDGEGENKQFELYCEKKQLYNIESEFSENGFVVEGAEVKMKAINLIPIPESDMAKVEKFFELIMNQKYVKNIFTNIEEN